MATAYSDAYTSLLFATSNASVAMGNAISKASSMYGETGQDALKYIGSNFAAAQGYLTPFREAGQRSIGTLENMLGVNGTAAQTKAINNIITPTLETMQKFGQANTNQALAQFLGIVAPGYNIQANLGEINQAANAKFDSTTGKYNVNNMSKEEAQTALSEYYKNGTLDSQSVERDVYDQNLNAYLLYKTREKFGDADYPTELENIKNLLSRTGKGYLDGGQFKRFATNPDGTVMNAQQLQDRAAQNEQDIRNGIYPDAASMIGSDIERVRDQQRYAQSDAGKSLYNADGQYVGPSSAAYEQQFTQRTSQQAQGSAAPNTAGIMQGIVDQTTTNPLVQSMMQYQQEQGLKAYQNSAAAKGLLNSGRALEELQRQGQGQAATNVMPLVNSLMQQTLGGASGILQTGLSQTMSGATALAGSALSSVQSGLSSMVAQGNQAAQAAGQLAAQQAQLGSAVKMEVGKYQADARMLAGKVESDALNAMAQIQFGHDMGPYIKNLAPTPQQSGQTTAPGGIGGGGGYFGGQ